MKIQRKLIEEVASRVAGEDVIPVVNALMNKRDVSEFTLAENTKMEINIVRNMLYRLYNANLVTSIKRKDKTKGWYIYYWTLNLPRFQYLAKDIMRRRLTSLQERLERENSSHFYICPRNCIRLNFEQATDFEFKCPECGDLLYQDDNAKKIKDIEKEIKHLKAELKKKLPPMPKLPESKLAKEEAEEKLREAEKIEVKSAKKTKKKASKKVKQKKSKKKQNKTKKTAKAKSKEKSARKITKKKSKKSVKKQSKKIKQKKSKKKSQTRKKNK